MTLTQLRQSFLQKVFGDPSNTTVSNTVIDGYLNQAYQRFLIIVLTANGEWQVNGNFFTANLPSDRHDIAFESTLLKVNEVYVKSTTTGDYVKAKQRDVSNITNEPLTDYFPASPEFDVTDKHIFIYTEQNPAVAVTNGVKIHAQIEYTGLLNTSDEPQIPVAFQPYIYKKAAEEYCEDQEMFNKSNNLFKKNQLDEEEIKNFYSSRASIRPVVMGFQEANYH